jgi:hypothetical protein
MGYYKKEVFRTTSNCRDFSPVGGPDKFQIPPTVWYFIQFSRKRKREYRAQINSTNLLLLQHASTESYRKKSSNYWNYLVEWWGKKAQIIKLKMLEYLLGFTDSAHISNNSILKDIQKMDVARALEDTCRSRDCVPLRPHRPKFKKIVVTKYILFLIKINQLC